MISCSPSRVLSLLISTALVSLALIAIPKSIPEKYLPPPGIRLEVLKVRVLSETDNAKMRGPSDYIGPNVAVRLRLSSSDRGIYFLAPPKTISPLGHQVKIVDKGIIWVHGSIRGEESDSSPGLERLMDSLCEWLCLPPYSAVEWVEYDITKSVVEKHALSIFIKEGQNEQPREIISESYDCPKKER
jgi:hypothetical protein